MKKIIFASLILFSVNYLSAQQRNEQKIDSLKTIIKQTKNDSLKAATMLRLCEAYWSINPPEGLQYAHGAIAIAKAKNNKPMLADAYGEIGMNFALLSNNDSAAFYLKIGLQLAEELHNARQIALAGGTLGNVFYFQSKYPQAIEYYLKAVSASEECKDTMGLAASLSNIGSIYLGLNDFEKAQSYFEKALKLNIATHFKIYEAINLANLGVVYSKKGNNELSLSYLLKALAVNKEINEVPGIGSAMNGVAGAYNDLGKIDSAYYYAINGLQITTQVHSMNDMANSYLMLANILTNAIEKNNLEFLTKNFSGNKVKCYTQAKTYADSSVKIYFSISNYEQLAKAYLALSTTQSALGEYEQALETYRKYTAAHDTVFNTDINKKLTQKTMQYDFDKKVASDKQEQQKKDFRERLVRNSIAAGLGGALIFLVVVYRQRNKISKARKRSDELLLNILPEETAEELKRTGTTTAKDFDSVTVLFTDFKNFTSMSEKLTAQELVNEINYCYSAFDNIISKHGIEKIKTIGDSYMCAGGLPVVNKTNAVDTVTAAIEIRDFMLNEKQKRESEGKPYFEIRIGCNTGSVVAGIVGIKKFAYDIWGDTVNIASRMESSGEPGKINISGSTYELVKDKFTCSHRGKIEAKNKGMIDMYFVERAN